MVRGQTQRHSCLEAVANVVIGFCVTVLVQAIIFPAVGIYVSFATNVEIALWLTGISFIKQYVIRRVFNKVMVAPHLKEN